MPPKASANCGRCRPAACRPCPAGLTLPRPDSLPARPFSPCCSTDLASTTALERSPPTRPPPHPRLHPAQPSPVQPCTYLHRRTAKPPCTLPRPLFACLALAALLLPACRLLPLLHPAPGGAASVSTQICMQTRTMQRQPARNLLVSDATWKHLPCSMAGGVKGGAGRQLAGTLATQRLPHLLHQLFALLNCKLINTLPAFPGRLTPATQPDCLGDCRIVSFNCSPLLLFKDWPARVLPWNFSPAAPVSAWWPRGLCLPPLYPVEESTGIRRQ